MDGFLRSGALALAPDGSGLLVVEADNTDYSDDGSCTQKTAGYVAVRAPDGALGALKPLGADVVSAPKRLPDGTFAVLLATTVRLTPGECGPIVNLDLATLDASGTLTARTPLAQELPGCRRPSSRSTPTGRPRSSGATSATPASTRCT